MARAKYAKYAHTEGSYLPVQSTEGPTRKAGRGAAISEQIYETFTRLSYYVHFVSTTLLY